jgi:hypothetical protein
LGQENLYLRGIGFPVDEVMDWGFQARPIRMDQPYPIYQKMDFKEKEERILKRR